MLIKIDVAQPVVAWLEEQAAASDAANASEVAGRIVATTYDARRTLAKPKPKKAEGGDDGGG